MNPIQHLQLQINNLNCIQLNPIKSCCSAKTNFSLIGRNPAGKSPGDPSQFQQPTSGSILVCHHKVQICQPRTLCYHNFMYFVEYDGCFVVDILLDNL